MPGYDPHSHAERLGIEVSYRPLAHGLDGLWCPDYSLILLRPRMRSVVERCTLAHEIGHALLGHVDTKTKHEVLADRIAAQLLIPPTDITSAARGSDSAAAIARELGVTEHLLGVAIRFLDDPVPVPASVLAA